MRRGLVSSRNGDESPPLQQVSLSSDFRLSSRTGIIELPGNFNGLGMTILREMSKIRLHFLYSGIIRV